MNVINYQEYSPRTFLNKVIYKPVPKRLDKARKVKDNDFKIPNIEEYDNLIKYNYNVKQLKSICKNYKLKVSGNKNEKIYRVYNYLKYSFYAIKIQKIFRGFLIKKLMKMKGLRYRKKTTNDTDFLTFEKIKDIKFDQLFCFKGENDFYYGFDIYSLYNLCIKTEGNEGIKNPYNRKFISNRVIRRLRESIFITNRVLKRNVLYKFQKDTEHLSPMKKIELKTIEIFQKIDQLGFITDTKWFLTLSKIRLIRFLKELVDVWDYRANITHEIKKQVVHPDGRPFQDIQLTTLLVKSELTLKKYALNAIEKLVTRGVNKDSKVLGANYVLGALTIVNHNAANSLPWLYESFMPNPPNH